MLLCLYILLYIYTLACWCNFFNTSQPTFLPSSSYLSSLHNRACCGLFEITVPRLFIKLLYQNHCTTLFLLLDSIAYIYFLKNVLPKCDESIYHPPLYLKILPHILHVFLLIPFSYISSLPFYNFLSVLSFPVCVCFLTLYSIPKKI